MQQKTHRAFYRERLLNAAHRLARICRNDPIKLFGLLYMLDIRLFREERRSCTGEVYYAMADGPAPGTLRSLLVMRKLDVDVAIGILTSTDTLGPWTFDPRPFCGRELELLDQLETSYATVSSRDLVLDDADAWWHIYTRSGGVGAIIPYELTLVSPMGAIKSANLKDRMSFAPRFGSLDASPDDYGNFFRSANTPD